MKAEEFYKKQKEAGETENITSNDNPDFSLPFYQEIFSLMEGFAAQPKEQLGKNFYNILMGGEEDINISPIAWLETLLRICKKEKFKNLLYEHAQNDKDAVLIMLSELNQFAGDIIVAMKKYSAIHHK